jgi:penicillin amidase
VILIWFKRVLAALGLVLLLVAAAAGVYIYRASPALDGELRAAGLLGPVSVARDPSDVTHIKAQSPRDAWFALGYVHAQERGWQLEFNRRVMHGELSEVFGPATLETDKLLRTLGVVRAAERQWQTLPAEGRDAMQAYSEGISAFYAGSPQALPPEFHIVGTRPGGASGAAWSPVDSLAWSLMMALDLGGNWGTEFARLSAARVLKTGELWQLFPPYPGEQPASNVDFAKLYADMGVYRTDLPGAPPKVSGKPAASTALAMAEGINDWAAALGEAGGKGSNNWVVAGAHSASGKPLLANDPHLGLSAPAIWYFARLQAPAVGSAAGLDVIGATLPGLPFVVMGRTAKAAWGFTNTAPDVQDLYLEQINPANPRQYRVPSAGASKAEAWADFTNRLEIIRVKGQPDFLLDVRESRHGPVLSDAQKSHGELIDTRKYVIALRWSALDADNQTVLAGLRANRAQSAGELIAAFEAYHSPMQNVVTADVAGGVAFKAVGKVPLRKPGNDIRGIAPSPGWEERYDWDGWLPYAQTPEAGRAAVEARGWWSTANQRITPPAYPFFMGQDWTVPYRYDRIEQLLAATPKHDVDSMQKIQADQLSPATVRLLPFLQKTLSQPVNHPLADAARKAMAGFDGTMRAGQAAPLLFAAWADELTRGIVGGKLGEAVFRPLYGKRHFRSTLEEVLERQDANWCGSGRLRGAIRRRAGARAGPPAVGLWCRRGRLGLGQGAHGAVGAQAFRQRVLAGPVV